MPFRSVMHGASYYPVMLFHAAPRRHAFLLRHAFMLRHAVMHCRDVCHVVPFICFRLSHAGQLIA